MDPERELVIIADRVLIAPDNAKTKTSGGLYLPQGIAEKEKVQTGFVKKTGPGYILPHTDSSEPWQSDKNEPHFVPLQVKEGDYAIFLKREAIEIEFDNEKYLIIPQAAILAVVRDQLPPLPPL